ncbi:integral membrane protein [Fusarium sp. NRRL 52700]|nr:integral membrane protein [Fusarium sp. NRRL 52700]
MNMTAEEMAAKASESRSGVAVGVSVSLMALSAVMVGLRLWCRRQRKMLGLDDATAVVALACILGCGVSIAAMTHYGLGRHIYTLSREQIKQYLRPTVWLVSGIVHIVTDFAIIIMPLPIVWKLQLPLSQKIYLTGIFGLGTLTVAIAVLRVQWLDPVADMTWWNVTAASWSMAEIVSGITCACLPTFKPLLVGIKSWFPQSSQGDSTICLQDQGIDEHTGSSLTEFESHGGVGTGPKAPARISLYGTQTSISASQEGNKLKKQPT